VGGRLVVAEFTFCTTRERQRAPEQSPRLSMPHPDLRRNCFGEHVDNSSRIVAVHGLTGHWLRSWTADGSESTYFWLAQALPRSFPTARIVSCEHGGLRENTIESLLWDLLGDREASGCDQVPIVILAHSFGGTLAKQIFIASSPSRNPSEEAQKLHWHIKGFMFFGTTNAGRPSERWSFAFRSSVPWVLVPGHRADPAALIEYLEQVEAVNKDFDSCGGSRVPTVCFYETKPTRIWGWYGVRAHAAAPRHTSFADVYCRSYWSPRRWQLLQKRSRSLWTPTTRTWYVSGPTSIPRWRWSWSPSDSWSQR